MSYKEIKTNLRGCMKSLKIPTYLLILLFLNGCAMVTELIGPKQEKILEDAVDVIIEEELHVAESASK